jgi:DNA repair protein RadC
MKKSGVKEKKNDDLSVSGHRARLRERFMIHDLSNPEVFELLLTYAIPRIDVRPLARRLLRGFGSVHKVLAADIGDLTRIAGIGINSAIFVKAVYEILLLDHRGYLEETPVFQDPKRLTNYCLLKLASNDVEELHVLYLDRENRLLADNIHSRGTIDWTAVYPREILKRALNINAINLILVHNHPDGARSFSTEDIQMTLHLRDLLKPVNVDVLDHLLVVDGIVFSAKNLFLLK